MVPDEHFPELKRVQFSRAIREINTHHSLENSISFARSEVSLDGRTELVSELLKSDAITVWVLNKPRPVVRRKTEDCRNSNEIGFGGEHLFGSFRNDAKQIADNRCEERGSIVDFFLQGEIGRTR